MQNLPEKVIISLTSKGLEIDDPVNAPHDHVIERGEYRLVKRAMSIRRMTEEELNTVLNAEMPSRYKYLDEEMDKE